MVTCFELTAQLSHLLALGAGQSFVLTAVGALLAHPVTRGLLVHAELASDVGDGAMLIQDEGSGILAELARIAASSAPRRGLLARGVILV
jgi:hypothetical protein